VPEFTDADPNGCAPSAADPNGGVVCVADENDGEEEDEVPLTRKNSSFSCSVCPHWSTRIVSSEL
jgi:hypothetical protein